MGGGSEGQALLFDALDGHLHNLTTLDGVLLELLQNEVFNLVGVAASERGDLGLLSEVSPAHFKNRGKVAAEKVENKERKEALVVRW